MMTRYVYILTSPDNDAYLETDAYAAMCLISALSVRGVDAEARITVLCDALTCSMLERCRHPLLAVVDEVLEYALTEPPQLASRMLKTTLLQRLQSDFIFLDVDTAVVQPIAPQLSRSQSVQMALDRYPYIPKPGFPAEHISTYEQLGWPWPTRRYFNSGVMLVRAETPSYQLFEQWHAHWRTFINTGLHQDQPSLNHVIDKFGIDVGILPLSYNAMVRVREAFRWRARVLHLFASTTSLYDDAGSEYTQLIASVTAGRPLTSEAVRRAVTRRWPLVEPWNGRRHLEAGDLRGAWVFYRQRLSSKFRKSYRKA